MSILREIVQYIEQPTEACKEHPQQGKTFQVPSLRKMFWPADEPGQTPEETRGGRSNDSGRPQHSEEKPDEPADGRRIVFRRDTVVHGKGKESNFPKYLRYINCVIY